MSNSKLTNGQCGICANCAPQINGGSGFINCGEAHAAQFAEDVVMTNRLTAERMDDETLSELIEFRRDSAKYHAEQGHKHQAMLHELVLNALLELQEYRKAVGEPVAWLNDAYLGRGVVDGEAGSEDAGPGYIPVYRHPQNAAPQQEAMQKIKVFNGVISVVYFSSL